MSKNISVTLYCQTCGNSDFEHNEDKTYIKCNHCKREYRGGINELTEYNQEAIQDATDDLTKELINDFTNRLETKLRGNKHIKLKRK